MLLLAYMLFLQIALDISFSVINYLGRKNQKKKPKKQAAQLDCDINVSFIHCKNVISERDVGWKCGQQPGKHMIGVGKQRSGYLQLS